MHRTPAVLLALCCVLLALFALAFDPYAERMEPGFWQWLGYSSPFFGIAAFLLWLAAVVFSLLSVIMGWWRCRNAWVLLGCFLLPCLFLLLGQGLKWCLSPYDVRLW